MVAEWKVVKIQAEQLGLHFSSDMQRRCCLLNYSHGRGLPYTAAMHVSSTAEKWKLEIFIIQNLKDTR